MRAHIITLFNSFNHGAFLQAFALGQVLEGIIGNNVSYIDTGARSIERSYKSEVKTAIKHLNVNKASFTDKKRAAFQEAIKVFSVEDLANSYTSNDLIVFGSDEILNIARKAISDYPALWGSGFEGGYRVAYAPSANGADLSAYQVSNELSWQLRGFKALSARDASTAESIEHLIGRPAQVVCDPTLLLNVEDFRLRQIDPSQNKYLLVYSYGKAMTEEDIADIQSFAKANKLKTISAGTYLEWCDESLPCGPFEFLGLVDKADYIVTDTFHGTLFATIYDKKFATYGRVNSKVVEFLQMAGLQDRDPARYSSLAGCLESCEETDYKNNKLLTDLRSSSQAYLQNAVDAFLEEAFSESDGSTSEINTITVDRVPIEVRENIDLTPYTTVHIGGIARRLWAPHKGDDLTLLPKDIYGRYRILSAGSNLLIDDQKSFDDVIYMGEYDDAIESLGNGLYQVGASVRIQQLIRQINLDGYGGIEELISIPAMIGGLVCMNASVPSAKVSISDHLVSIDILQYGQIITISKQECGFGYRRSCFQDGKSMILSALFQFPEQKQDISAARIAARQERCKQIQDHSAYNFGSVFAKSSPRIMKLVSRWGLHSGGCSFSHKTTNWLLNHGGNYSDAIKIIKRVERLHSLAGRSCEREVRVWE